jgi:hypothetical protein
MKGGSITLQSYKKPEWKNEYATPRSEPYH